MTQKKLKNTTKRGNVNVAPGTPVAGIMVFKMDNGHVDVVQEIPGMKFKESVDLLNTRDMLRSAYDDVNNVLMSRHVVAALAQTTSKRAFIQSADSEESAETGVGAEDAPTERPEPSYKEG